MDKGTHLTRPRHAHQAAAAALYIIMNQTYENYRNSPRWPQFQYWISVLELELCVIEFVAFIRQAKFSKHMELLNYLIPWMFSLNCVNYVRWLSVHARDISLNTYSFIHSVLRKCTFSCYDQAFIECDQRYCPTTTLHPEVHQEFCSRGFAVHKTNNSFSAISIDHAHEQCNALVEGGGGGGGGCCRTD